MIRVGFLCDLSELSGLGHIKRCLVLSKELEKLGCDCCFFSDLDTKEIFSTNVSVKKIITVKFNIYENYKKLIKIFKKEKINIIILDTYRYLHDLEFLIRSSGFFTVSIDDHLRRHDGHLVFNNRSKNIDFSPENPRSSIWHIGQEYIIANKTESKKISVSGKRKLKKILLHAGGSSAYTMIAPLVHETCKVVKRHQLTLDVLCTNLSAKVYIENIISELNLLEKVNIRPYISNLESEVRAYDIVVGPAGTTTYECIQAGVLTLSVPLTDDGRDSPESWPYIGHMLHLNFEESRNSDVIEKLWEFCICRFDDLGKILDNHRHILDGKGAERIARKILDHFNSDDKHLVEPEVVIQNNKTLTSKIVEIEDARVFLNARNQDFVRENSSNPDHKISWPEHLNWWFRNDVIRSGLWKDGTIIGFHWSKPVKDEKGMFVISGWMPVAEIDNKFQVAAWLIEHQVTQVKAQFCGELWLISMKKENSVAQFLNKRAGFMKASPNSAARAASIFGVSNENFDFMEMKV